MQRNLAKHEENETCGAAAGMSKNLLQEPSKLQNIRKRRLWSSPGYAEEPSKNMKKTKPSIAAPGIPKNLLQEPSNFKISGKRRLWSSPGYAMEWKLPKHEENEAYRSSRGYSEKPLPTNLPNLQNGRKQRLRSSPGYAEEPCKT